MSISKQIPDHIKRVSRSLGYFLWIGTPDDLYGLSVVLRARLTPRQRASLAFASLQSLDHDLAYQTAEAAMGRDAGSPIAPLFNHMDEAAFWADMATPDELDAYALASFNRMAPQRQAAFLGFIRRRAAA